MLRLFLLSAIVNCVLGENVKWRPWFLVPDKDHFIKECQHWVDAAMFMSIYNHDFAPKWGDLPSKAVAQLQSDWAHIASEGQVADPSVKKYFDEITAELNMHMDSNKRRPSIAILWNYRQAYLVLKRQLEGLKWGELVPAKYLETVWRVLWGAYSFVGAPIEMWFRKLGWDSRKINLKWRKPK